MFSLTGSVSSDCMLTGRCQPHHVTIHTPHLSVSAVGDDFTDELTTASDLLTRSWEVLMFDWSLINLSGPLRVTFFREIIY